MEGMLLLFTVVAVLELAFLSAKKQRLKKAGSLERDPASKVTEPLSQGSFHRTEGV